MSKPIPIALVLALATTKVYIYIYGCHSRREGGRLLQVVAIPFWEFLVFTKYLYSAMSRYLLRSALWYYFERKSHHQSGRIMEIIRFVLVPV